MRSSEDWQRVKTIQYKSRYATKPNHEMIKSKSNKLDSRKEIRIEGGKVLRVKLPCHILIQGTRPTSVITLNVATLRGCVKPTYQRPVT